jgi:hypothetical protein
MEILSKHVLPRTANLGEAWVILLPNWKITIAYMQLFNQCLKASLDQLPDYIKQKLVEKQRIDEAIKEADAVLQSRNATLEAINEYLKLNQELEKHRLSTHDIHKLLSVLSIAKKYGFGGKEIAEKLWNIQDLEWKEKELKDKCKKLSKTYQSTNRSYHSQRRLQLLVLA